MFQLRPYQEECVSAIMKTFDEEPIASVNMFCGLGKTCVIVSTLNRIDGLKVIVFPTLQLVSQFIKKYKGSVQGEIKVSCSENSECVKDIKIHWSEITAKHNVICTTYQSLPNVLGNNIYVQLIVFDESHRTEAPTVSCAIEQNHNKINKSLYVSATPPDSHEICFNMSHYDGLNTIDETTGNPVCADISLHLLLKEANNDREFLKQIADVAKETGNKRILAYSTRVNNDDPNWNSVKRFYNDNATHSEELGIKLLMISSESSAGDRDNKIQEFHSYPDNKIVILISCRTIGEGTDVKNANSVVFLDPKGSAKDIIQNIGRTTRPNDNGNDSASTVLIPVRVNREEYLKLETAEELDEYIRNNMADSGGFAMISNVIAALKQCDEELYELLLRYPNRLSPMEKKKHYKANNVQCEEVPRDGNCLFHSILRVEPKVAKDVSELRSKVADYMLENLDKYESYVENRDVGVVAEQIRDDGHWNFDGMDVVPYIVSDMLQRQLHIHTDKNLEKPLEIINEKQFKCKNKIMLDLTGNHYSPIVPVQSKGKQHKKGMSPVKPRRRYNVTKDLQLLLKLKKADLEIENRVSVAVEHTLVDNRLSKTNKAREAAEHYMQNNNKWPVVADKTLKFSDGSALIGSWLSNQRTHYKGGKLEDEINNILSEVDPNWHTPNDPNDKQNKAHEAAECYKQNNNKWPSDKDKTIRFSDGSACIGAWISDRRKAYKSNTLEDEINRILSEADPSWHTPNDPNNKLNKAHEAAAHYKQNNNKWPSADDKTIRFRDGSACIGMWISHRRKAYKDGKLEDEINRILSEVDPNWHTPNDQINKAHEAAEYYRQNNNKWPSNKNTTIKFSDGSTHIGSWLSCQRKAYKDGTLEDEIKMILTEADPSWHTANNKQNKAHEAAEYYRQNNNKWPSNKNTTIKFSDGSACVGAWLGYCRRAYKDDKLDKEINKILTAADPSWHTHNDPNDKTNKAHEAAKFYKQNNNKWPSNKNTTIKFSNGSACIGMWISDRRKAYKSNTLEDEINRILSEVDPNWHTPKAPKSKPKSKLSTTTQPPKEQPTVEDIHEDLSMVQHDHDESRKAIRKYTSSQLTMHLKNIKRENVASVNKQGYVERNPGFKEVLNGIFSKNVVNNEQKEGCVVVLDHLNFNTTSTLVGDGVKLEDIKVPNSHNAKEMCSNEEYGSCVKPLNLVHYIRSEKTPIRAMYADLCGTVDEAEKVIDALVETRRMVDGGLLMITICERSTVNDALSAGRGQISDLQEKLQDLGRYKRLSGVDYGAGACMATYMWKLNKQS